MEDIACIIYRDNYPNGEGNPGSQNYTFYGGSSIPDLNKIGMNDCISAMYIHPRFAVAVHKDINGGGAGWLLWGKDFPRGIVSNQYLRSINANDCISSIDVFQQVEFAEWKKNCCRNIVGNFTDSGKCGKYWSGPECEKNMGCTGEELLGVPICKTWCKNFPNSCDSLKLSYCQTNKTAPMCGCINEPDITMQERTKASYKGPRQCWAGSDCQKSDLVDTLIPTTLIPQNCPTTIDQSIHAYDDAIVANNSQSIDYTSNGTSSGMEISQPQPIYKEPASASDFTMIYILIFIIIICIIVAIVYFVFKKPKTQI